LPIYLFDVVTNSKESLLMRHERDAQFAEPLVPFTITKDKAL